MRRFDKVSKDFRLKVKALDLLADICNYEIKDPLYVHSIEVAARCSSDKARAVAFLHDVVEDTSMTIDDVERMFGHEIAKTVYALTRVKTETYFEYIHRLILSKDAIAIEVKKADLADHLAKKDTLKDSLKKRYELALKLIEDLGV